MTDLDKQTALDRRYLFDWFSMRFSGQFLLFFGSVFIGSQRLLVLQKINKKKTICSSFEVEKVTVFPSLLLLFLEFYCPGRYFWALRPSVTFGGMSRIQIDSVN